MLPVYVDRVELVSQLGTQTAAAGSIDVNPEHPHSENSPQSVRAQVSWCTAD